MKYFWWIISFIVLAGVALVMKFSLKPHVVNLISPSTLGTGSSPSAIDSGGTQLASVVTNQLRAYFDQRRVVVLGLPWFEGVRPGEAHVNPRALQDFAMGLSRQNHFAEIWLLQSQVLKRSPTSADWPSRVHVAENWRVAGEKFQIALRGPDHVLVITDAVDNYDFQNPEALIAYLATHFNYAEYLSLTVLPASAREGEKLPSEMNCAEENSGSSVGASVDRTSYCKTDLPNAVENAARALRKSKKIDRQRPVITAEQRASSIFAVFVHSP